MNDLLPVLLKGLAGGSLVVAFAALSELLGPKRFAGLFSAAPAVAIAGLAIAGASKPPHDLQQNAIGMLAGCAGMVAYAAVAPALLSRTAPLRASTLGVLVWVIVAGAVAAPLLA